jgi:O-antigen/teichoic acid export membrane protein
MPQSRGTASGSGRAVIANMLGLGVAGLAGVLLLLLIATLRGPESLGRFNLLFAVHLVGSQVATLGLHVSVVRHLSALDELERRGPVLRGALVATLLTAGGTALLLLVGRRSLAALLGRPELADPLAWVALGVLLFALNKVLLAALTAIGRLGLHAALIAARGILMLVVLTAISAADMADETLVLVLVVAEAGLLVPLVIALRSELRGGRRGSVTPGWVLTHLRFGAMGAGSSLLMELNVRVDVLVLALFVDDRAIGVYTLVAALSEAALQVPMVHRTVLSPQTVRLVGAADATGLRSLVRTTAARLWPLMSAIAVALVLAQPTLIRLLGADEVFLDGRLVLAVLMAGVVVAAGYIPFGLLLAYGGRPLAQTGLAAGLVVLNLGGNLLLIPTFGLLGAALSTALVNVASVPLLRIAADRLLGLRI